MKISKIFSTSIFAGLLSLSTTVNAIDLNYVLQDLFDVTAAGEPELANVPVSVIGFRVDQTYGPVFDTLSIGGEQINFEDFNQAFTELFNAPDDAELEIDEITVTAGELKQIFSSLVDKVLSDPRIISAFQEQGYSAAQIEQISIGTAQQKIQFISQIAQVQKINDEIQIFQKIMIPAMNAAMGQIAESIDSRSDIFNQNENFGISSGNENGRGFGAWIKGITAKDNYKISGKKYNMATNSGIVGFDFKTMDNLILGLAFGYQQREVSKEKIKFHNAVGTIYGTYLFNDNMFTDVKYSYGRGVVTNKKNKLKFKGTNNTHNANARFGYNILVADNTLVTPTIGAKYGINHLSIKSNAFGDNISTKAKNGNYSAWEVAAKLAHKIDTAQGALIPYVRVSYEGLMSNKKTKIILTNKTTNKSLTVKLDNIDKYRLSAGTGIGVAIRNIDLGAEYMFSKSKLYKGHKGALTLRVNF